MPRREALRLRFSPATILIVLGFGILPAAAQVEQPVPVHAKAAALSPAEPSGANSAAKDVTWSPNASPAPAEAIQEDAKPQPAPETPSTVPAAENEAPPIQQPGSQPPAATLPGPVSPIPAAPPAAATSPSMSQPAQPPAAAPAPSFADLVKGALQTLVQADGAASSETRKEHAAIAAFYAGLPSSLGRGRQARPAGRRDLGSARACR